jgi:heme/copper-type cytochrome/quinol oxidase subunit 3
MSVEQRRIDVSTLPPVVYDHRSSEWWGTIGFMLIEGVTLALMAASYLYLRMNELDWPPGRTPDPDVLMPTVSTAILLLMMWPMYRAGAAARREDRGGVIKWLLFAVVLSVILVSLRWVDLLALNVRYDAHAYASAAWGVVLLHGTLLVADLGETIVMAAMFITGRATRKHYSDVVDAALYQYFLSLIWVPLYVIVYWSPRLW